MPYLGRWFVDLIWSTAVRWPASRGLISAQGTDHPRASVGSLVVLVMFVAIAGVGWWARTRARRRRAARRDAEAEDRGGCTP